MARVALGRGSRPTVTETYCEYGIYTTRDRATVPLPIAWQVYITVTEPYFLPPETSFGSRGIAFPMRLSAVVALATR